jgi:hypothetical protein
MLGGERVLVVVGESRRVLDEGNPCGCETCGSQSEAADSILRQLSVAVLPSGASQFAPLLSLSYTTHYDQGEEIYDEATTSWGLTVDKRTSEVLEE